MKFRHLSLVVVAGLLSGCAEQEAAAPIELVRPVKILTVGLAGDALSLELPGVVRAAREAVIAFEVAGRVTEIAVREGQMVAEGDVLARLDPRDYEASRDSALARREAAAADYQRYVEARKANAVTDQDVDLAKRTLDVAQADLNQARKAVEDTVIRAPFSGRVADRIIDNFENVLAKQAVFEVHDESGFEVSVNVAERDWARATPDLSIEEVTARLKPEIEVSAYPDRRFAARAKAFATAIDPVTRTYETTFAFANPVELNVTPGMTAKVIVYPDDDLGNADAQLLVPSGAVFGASDGAPSVWLVTDDMQVARQSVVLGPLIDGAFTITAGLNRGQSIAISGVHTLVEGMVVRPLEP
ncbi:MAG: efflux RND transporter periplasmic adaptor subunit [Pseudomonadota bacterium]